jgi:hypothetical protein
MPVILWFEGDGWDVHVHEEMPVPAGGDSLQKTAVMTQEAARLFEAGIRAHPQDWHMLQRVFAADLAPGRLRRGRRLASAEALPGLQAARQGFKARRRWFQGRGRVGSPDVARLASRWRQAPAHTAAAPLGVNCRGVFPARDRVGALAAQHARQRPGGGAGLRAGRGRRGPGSLHSGNSLSSPVVTSPARHVWPRPPGLLATRTVDPPGVSRGRLAASDLASAGPACRDGAALQPPLRRSRWRRAV